jgi:DNA-binding CsgD family transcriptional regulator
METLSSADIRLLNQSIQQLYALPDRTNFGVDALAIVHQLVPSEVPIFQQTNTRTHTVAATFLPGNGWDTPENLRLIREVLPQHLGEHPILQNMPLTLNGTYKISDFLSETELHQRAGIYQQFLRPLEIEEQMQFFLPVERPGSWQQLAQMDTVQSGFILNRDRRSFTERDRLILNLLRPHLFQAYANVQRYEQITQDLNQLQRSVSHLGLINFDRQGRMEYVTPTAAAWLATYFTPATAPNHLPDALWDWVQDQRNALQQPTERTIGTPLQITQLDQQLVVRLVLDRWGDRYSLLLEEQTAGYDTLGKLGLSQRETAVLEFLMQGKDNKTIALAMDVHVGTVRKHLENIYRKLNVHSRTEAVSAALEKLGLYERPSP